jgi:hypothetical protein
MLGCPAQPWPTHGPACILADVGEGAGALHCGPGLRCLTWSRPLGLAGGWELGPRRAHSRLGGGRLTVVHSDSRGEPKATIRPGDHGSVTGCPWQRARAADQRTHAAYSVQISQRRAMGMRCAAGQLTERRADCAADWAHIWSTRSASMVDLGQDQGGAPSQQVPHFPAFTQRPAPPGADVLRIEPWPPLAVPSGIAVRPGARQRPAAVPATPSGSGCVAARVARNWFGTPPARSRGRSATEPRNRYSAAQASGSRVPSTAAWATSVRRRLRLRA